MAKSKRNISRKRKQSRKLTQKGTKRNRKLKRGKLVGGYNKESFLIKFEALGLPNLGADVDSEISKRIEDNNSIKDFLTKKNKSAVVSGKIYNELTGYEKYCIENTTRRPHNFKFEPPRGPINYLKRAAGLSIEKGDTNSGQNNTEAFNAYVEQRKIDIPKFIDDFAGKKSAILELFDVLDEEATAEFLDNETGVLQVSNEDQRQELIAKLKEDENTDSQTKENGN